MVEFPEIAYSKPNKIKPNYYNAINIVVTLEDKTKVWLQFLHADTRKVKHGEEVTPDKVLGIIGNTCKDLKKCPKNMGTHLHVEATILVNGKPVHVDPITFKPLDIVSKQLSVYADPEEELLFNADVSFESERYEEAITYYDEYLAIVPNDQDALDAKAAAELKLEKSTLPTIAKEKPQLDDTSRGGCLIATATYGTELAPQVQQLRELRDNTLLQTNSGSAFMESFNQFYYSFSPTIADWERQNPMFKEAVKLAITPLLTSLSILNYVDIDSEAEVLGYGISLILLNVGMYFVAPAVIIIKIRSKFNV